MVGFRGEGIGVLDARTGAAGFGVLDGVANGGFADEDKRVVAEGFEAGKVGRVFEDVEEAFGARGPGSAAQADDG